MSKLIPLKQKLIRFSLSGHILLPNPMGREDWESGPTPDVEADLTLGEITPGEAFGYFNNGAAGALSVTDWGFATTVRHVRSSASASGSIRVDLNNPGDPSTVGTDVRLVIPSLGIDLVLPRYDNKTWTLGNLSGAEYDTFNAANGTTVAIEAYFV